MTPFEKSLANCQKKKRMTSGAADMRIAMYAEKKFKKRIELRKYMCPHCSFWHLTSKKEPYVRNGHASRLSSESQGETTSQMEKDEDVQSGVPVVEDDGVGGTR